MNACEFFSIAYSLAVRHDFSLCVVADSKPVGPWEDRAVSRRDLHGVSARFTCSGRHAADVLALDLDRLGIPAKTVGREVFCDVWRVSCNSQHGKQN